MIGVFRTAHLAIAMLSVGANAGEFDMFRSPGVPYLGAQAPVTNLADAAAIRKFAAEYLAVIAAGSEVRSTLFKPGQSPQEHSRDVGADAQSIYFFQPSADTINLVVKMVDGLVLLKESNDGSFGPPATIFTGTQEPVDGNTVVVVRLNSDSALDVVSAGTRIELNPPVVEVHAILNDGTDHFTNPQTIAMPDMFFLTSVAGGDINGDGRPEVVISGVGSTRILTSQPNGTLLYLDTTSGLSQAAPTPPLPGAVGDCALFDLNKDGHDDLILPANAGGFSVRLGQANNSLGAPGSYSGLHAQRILCGDFNFDGFNDVAIAGETPGKLAIYDGVAGGGLATPKTVDGPANPRRIGFVEPFAEFFTYPAFFAVHPNEDVLQGYVSTPAGPASADRQLFVDNTGTRIDPSEAVKADVNGDGWDDIVTIEVGNDLFFSLNKTDGSGELLPAKQDRVTFSRHLAALPPAPGADARQRIAINFDGSVAAGVFRLNSQANPTDWIVQQTFNLPQFGVDVASGDINGDGRADLIYTHTSGPAAFTVVTQDALGMFTVGSSFGPPGAWSVVALGDLDSAHGLDVVLGNGTSGAVQTLLNNGSGSFSVAPGGSASFPPPLSTNIASGDFDGDGSTDMVIGAGPAALSNGSVRVLYGDGAGGFSGSLNIPAVAPVPCVYAADSNHDGLPDIQFATVPPLAFGDGRFGVILNSNAGLPALPTSYHYISGDPKAIFVADLKNPVGGAGRLSSASPLTAIAVSKVSATPYEGLTVLEELPSSSTCAGDLDGDQFVDDSDFSIFVVAYDILDCAEPAMPAGCPADLNGDQVVDDADFSIFVVAYNALLCP